jgi:hypothetical protein
MAARWAAYLARWREHLHGVQSPIRRRRGPVFRFGQRRKGKLRRSLATGGKGIRTIGPRKRISVFRKPPRPPSPPGEAVSPKNLPFLVQADSSLVFPQFATPRLRPHPLATRALPAHASLRGCQSVRPNAPPGRCGNLSPVLHTEDLTVRFGGLPTLNRVNSEASETKGLALDVIAPLTR